jgi:hypothetical protein
LAGSTCERVCLQIRSCESFNPSCRSRCRRYGPPRPGGCRRPRACRAWSRRGLRCCSSCCASSASHGSRATCGGHNENGLQQTCCNPLILLAEWTGRVQTGNLPREAAAKSTQCYTVRFTVKGRCLYTWNALSSTNGRLDATTWHIRSAAYHELHGSPPSAEQPITRPASA